MNDTKAIYDFTQITRSGKMKWKKEEPGIEDFSNSKVVELYTVEHNGEKMELSLESRVDEEAEVNLYRSIIHLWILDDNGDKLWRFPDNAALRDLLDTVRYQTGKVADRIKRLTGS